MKATKRTNGFTILETLIVIVILGIVIGMMLPLLGDFNNRRDVENSALMLLEDIRKTQQFARVFRDNFAYYGIKLRSGLGEGGDRYGYELVRFEAPNNPPAAPVTDLSCPISGVNRTGINECVIVKSPNQTLTPPQEYLEDTFFPERVVIFAGELIVGEIIIFNPQGSATTDGMALLAADNDQITLIGKNNYIKRLTIAALTGYVKIE